jgi:hypothetical protein
LNKLKRYYSFRPATTASSAAHTPSSLPCTGPLRTSSVAPPDSHHLHHVRALPASGPLHQQSCHPDPPSPRALHGLPAIRGLTPFLFFFSPPPSRKCHPLPLSPPLFLHPVLGYSAAPLPPPSSPASSCSRPYVPRAHSVHRAARSCPDF